MATSKLELAVGTGQWDAGIKKAQSSLSSFINAQGGLSKALDAENAKIGTFVQMMGKMDSTAKTAKGQMSEYKSIIEQLTLQYNRMTDAQRKAVGQDYLQAIDQIKAKYHQVAGEVEQLNKSLSGSGGAVGGGGGLFGGGKLEGALQVLGGNLMTKAAGVAMSFANSLKDAAVQGIEMAKAGEGIRNAFERLNRPDLLDKLKEATHGTVTELELMKQAVKFNDFKLNLDDMGTLLAFAQQKAKDTGQSVDYMVDSIVTGLGRQSLMILDNLGLSASQVKEKMKETGDMTKAVAEIIREQMSDAGEYVETAADRAAKADADLKNAMEELGRTLSPLADQGSSLWNTLEIGAIKTLNNGIKPLVPVLLELKNTIGDIFSEISNSPLWDAYISSMEKAGEVVMNSVNPALSTLLGLLKAVPEEKPILGAAISQLANAANGGGGSGSVSSNPQKNKTKTTKIDKVFAPDSIAAMEKYISDLTKKWKEAGDNVRDLYAVQIDAAKKKLAEMTGSASPTGSIADLTARMNELKKEQNLATGTEGWKNMQREINALAIQIKELKGEMGGVSITEGITESISSRQLELKTGKLDTSTVDKKIKELKDGGDDIRKSWQTAGNAISQLGAAMQSIEDPAMKVFSIVAQAVATVALSFSKALGEDKTTKGNIWAFIGAAAASTAAMITMISQIHSATGFARGGIVDGTSGGFVGGTSFSGDNIGNVRLDAGELVLNKSQQNNLANALQSSYAQSETQKPYVTGEMIYIALTNYMRRSGQGETLKFR